MPRILCEGARYHVSARANRQEMIFAADETNILFLSVVKEAKRKFVFHLENLCIMGNHIHFIIRPGWGESLSAIMQWILGVFAMRYNRAHHLTGHVWGERFFSRIIENLREYLKIFLYIDANPIAAGLVARAKDWLYGRHNLGLIGFGDIVASPASWVDWP
jgi:putative transposase